MMVKINMDESQNKKTGSHIFLPTFQPGNVCCDEKFYCGMAATEGAEDHAKTMVLNIELVVIDLSVCARCVPTGDQL
jgi:hypothetical protein